MPSMFLVLFVTSLLLNGTQSYMVQRKFSGSRYTPLLLKNKIDCSAEKLKEQDRYICTEDGEIRCLSGWTKEELKCVIPDCSLNGEDGCKHGRCIAPHTCACDIGWEGPLCDTCVTMPNCEHGNCTDALGCKCHNGWEGYFCNIPICKENCSITNGFCNNPGKCECMFGWQGEDCNDCAKLDSCTNGHCSTKPFECICDEGYSGPNCDIAGCNCVHGMCNTKNGQCDCVPGWFGKHCEHCLPNLNKCNKCKDNIPWTCEEGSDFSPMDTGSFEERLNNLKIKSMEG